MAMDATSILGSQLGAAAGCAYALNLLQKWSRTPWITSHTTGINNAVRAALALAATIGIGWAWAPIAAGGHVLSISIPSGPDLMHGIWHWFCQFAFTHVVGNSLQTATTVAAGASPSVNAQLDSKKP
jgi:hypothetical protein